MNVQSRADNKKIGELVCDGAMKFVDNFAVEINGERVAEYKSLDAVAKDWEDYKPTEPLIKDEKIRKAVRAWAEVNDFEPDCKVRYGANSYSLFSSEASIEFNICIKGLEHLKDYTIKELCGEEEE